MAEWPEQLQVRVLIFYLCTILISLQRPISQALARVKQFGKTTRKWLPTRLLNLSRPDCCKLTRVLPPKAPINMTSQPCQSLFVAPCSHTWHYKCIRIIINGPHWPHFICPNCRSVADLEAELDDPSGNWEEVDPAEATIQTPQTTEPSQNTQQSREQVSSADGTGVLVEPPESVDSQPHRNGSGTIEIAEVSDDSSADDRVSGARRDLSSLHINDESPSPSDSESPAQQTSNATVAPLDIISRKPVPGVSIATSSHLEQPNSHMERTSTRTPSPNGLSSLVGDALAGVEGPMTPRNDAGPFIFDGSAGRGADVQLAALATMNLTAAAVTPLPETPQSAA